MPCSEESSLSEEEDTGGEIRLDLDLIFFASGSGVGDDEELALIRG